MPFLRILLIKDKLAREYEGTRFVQWLKMSAQFNNKFLKCEDLKNMDKVQCVGESEKEICLLRLLVSRFHFKIHCFQQSNTDENFKNILISGKFSLKEKIMKAFLETRKITWQR